ncbi:methyl-accepting chemotaxis protein [Paenibacillus alginolyticus]|uniref:Methyl-accepting chemotaxis protein n=1 Tax=Paenibacillus alginolyticus TaxID=59839 RepID=A0ABT4G9C6_9BACL|nr:methyl-accepting chemotaxis protein [Paenibacillus alginolyticus]MCY9692771.1 methyl-accepting chemotaxis protein [Paenibacillus alginolyticus]MEC0146092.1 methyl-accepting chemotaxis protein [Paenibacillus alginolyticus]
MFDWLGFRKGLSLWWSYRLNRHLKEDVEHIFEGIAHTRTEILRGWVEAYWSNLDRLLEQLSDSEPGPTRQDDSMVQRLLAAALKSGSDFSEIFIVNEKAAVIYSTSPTHIGKSYDSGSDLTKGLEEARKGKKCLFGPYSDPLTLQLGPSTSPFHDAMTLAFIAPIMVNGIWKGAICGRVPNDVLGDLIQRESGHVYPDSGDNYLFMAKPVLNKQIAPGTALSRSRFEDLTFTHGDNLKDGVRTDYGIVGVKQHTELELVFTDPATGQLHPGVAGTIAKGHNLFVEFPGYSDYRHISVIGKGVTFQLPHCPDVWGMMCEGDLEEVYRIRSIDWKLLKLQLRFIVGYILLSAGGFWLLNGHVSSSWGSVIMTAVSLVYGGIGASIIRQKGSKPIVRQLAQMNKFIRINAEGSGDLTQRLHVQEFAGDETRELAKWINNMIDSLEGIMLQVKQAAAEVQLSQERMNESTSSTEQSTGRMSTKIHDMIRSLRGQLKDIDVAKDVTQNMSGTLRELEEKASDQIAVAQDEVDRIGEKMNHISAKVAETNRTIQTFLQTTQEIPKLLKVIEEISAQTNLLSLNASIEAARVGEHGKGFAVVAGEIRKLADLTKKSTMEINDTIEHIERHANEAFISMEEGTKVVLEGTQIVAAASEILSSANAHDTMKTQVVDEVVALMEKVAAVSMENRQISAEVERTVQELLQDMLHVRQTTGDVGAITESLLLLVNQFQLTESRIR